ncbi:MAG: GNAT family N-acetyltransferase, partial [Spirulinaceae cyanobacterium]
MFILAQTPEQFATIARLARSIWIAHYTPIIGAAQVDYMLAKFQSAEAIAAQVQTEGYRYYLA